MNIRNERNYPVFLRYAGKGRAGRNLRAGEVSPECPLDRLQIQVVQRHITEKTIKVFVTKDQVDALTGNIPDGVLKMLSTSKPTGAKVDPPVDVDVKNPPPKKESKAPDPADEPKSKHLDEVGEVNPETPKTAAELTADPVKAHAKKEQETPAPEAPVEAPVEASAPEEVEALAEEALTEVVDEVLDVLTEAPAEEVAESVEVEEEPVAAEADYKDLNKKQLLAEFTKRKLKKPAPSTSTTRLREKLIKDDESK